MAQIHNPEVPAPGFGNYPRVRGISYIMNERLKEVSDEPSKKYNL